MSSEKETLSVKLATAVGICLLFLCNPLGMTVLAIMNSWELSGFDFVINAAGRAVLYSLVAGVVAAVIMSPFVVIAARKSES